MRLSVEAIQGIRRTEREATRSNMGTGPEAIARVLFVALDIMPDTFSSKMLIENAGLTARPATYGPKGMVELALAEVTHMQGRKGAAPTPFYRPTQRLVEVCADYNSLIAETAATQVSATPDEVRERAILGYGTTIGIGHAGAEDIIEDAHNRFTIHPQSAVYAALDGYLGHLRIRTPVSSALRKML